MDFFNYMLIKINDITKNKINFLRNNIIVNKRHNINNSDCEIFDHDTLEFVAFGKKRMNWFSQSRLERKYKSRT